MDDERGSSARALEDLERINAACDPMAAIEEELEALGHRLKNADVAAIHLGVRRITEALLRHACTAEGATLPQDSRATLQPLKESLQSRRKDGLQPEFWRALERIIGTVNPNTHYQGNDVYNPVLRRHRPLDEVEVVLHELAIVAEEFIHHWPPPKVELPTAPRTESMPGAEEAPLPNSISTSPHNAVESAPPQVARPPLAEQRRYGAMNVAQAREDEAVRDWLATHSDVQQRGVTRRLNAEHGRCKLRNVFPTAFPDFDEAADTIGNDKVQTGKPSSGDPKAAREPAEPRDGRLDYLVIGRLTVAQARDLDVAEDIATITGLSPATVKAKLRTLHGSSVIHRQFSWFTDEVVGEMTVSTALRYELASFLPAAFGDTRSNLLRKLRSTPGQTKLKNLFSELGGSKA